MTANPSIDPARFLAEHLERAEPDLLRSMLKTFIDALQVQVRQDDARRPEGHPAQPAKHVEDRPGTELHEHFGHRLDQDPPELDAQLYAKYGLDPEEIAFIEAKVEAMD